MSRNLASPDSTQSASTIVNIVEFLSIAFPSGTVYLTTGDQNYTWGGHTYTPDGRFGSVSGLNETVDGKPRAASIVISGTDSALMTAIVGAKLSWISIGYAIGFVDYGGALVGTPSFTAAVFMGDCTVSKDKGTGQVTISGENRLANGLGRVSAIYAAKQDQSMRFAGDTFFDAIPALINRMVQWGGAQVQTGQTGGGGVPGRPTATPTLPV